jgi:hypothetical protein
MNGHLNHLAGLEQIADLQRAADRYRLTSAAQESGTRSPRRARTRASGGWVGLRRRLRLA